MAAATMNGAHTKFDSMPNFRRVNAQYFDKNGTERTTKLFRSSRPDFLTEEEAIEFKNMGIKSILDCRSATEYKKANGTKILDKFYPVYKVKLPLYRKLKITDPLAYKPVAGLAVANGTDVTQGRHYLVNFFKMNYIMAVYSRAPWYVKLYSLFFLIIDLIMNTGYRQFIRVFARNVLNKEGLVGQYKDILQYSQNQIYSVLKLLCDPENVPAMVNCAHGKDRTGITTALVLACFGKSKEFISLDYARSEEGLESVKERLHDEIVNKFHMCTTFTSAKADNMMSVLNFVEEHYGSLTNYLEYIGFTADDQAKLRDNLIL